MEAEHRGELHASFLAGMVERVPAQDWARFLEALPTLQTRRMWEGIRGRDEKLE